MKMVERFDVCARTSTKRLREIACACDSEYLLLYTGEGELRWVDFGLERMVSVARDTGAAMVYSDRFVYKDGNVESAPVIDWQDGALRDDFDFGGVQL